MTKAHNYLSQILSKTIDFYYIYRHFHWNITTQDFYQFHTLFDSHAIMIFASQDTLAERIRQLDFFVEQVKINVDTKMPDTQDNIQNILKFLFLEHQDIIKILTDAIDYYSDKKDFATADMLTLFLVQHQKMSWFIKSSIKEESN